METAYDLMTRLLTDHFGVPGEQITPDATFEELDIDSLAKVELVTLLEDHLKRPLEQAPAGDTLGETAAWVERLLRAGIGAQPQGETPSAAPARPGR